MARSVSLPTSFITARAPSFSQWNRKTPCHVVTYPGTVILSGPIGGLGNVIFQLCESMHPAPKTSQAGSLVKPETGNLATLLVKPYDRLPDPNEKSPAASEWQSLCLEWADRVLEPISS